MPKTLYERDMENSLLQIAEALGINTTSKPPKIEDIIRAAKQAGERSRDFDALQRALVGETGASGITAAAEYRKLLIDLDTNMRRAWKDGSLSADAWPTELAQRLTWAVKGKQAETPIALSFGSR